MDASREAFITRAADILEQVTDDDPDQIGLNAFIAIMQQMAKGVLLAATIALVEDNMREIDRLTGQAEVLTVLITVLKRQVDARDATELTPDLVDELEQILGDAL